MTGTIKITDLPNAGVMDGTERVAVVMGGVTKQCTTLQISQLIESESDTFTQPVTITTTTSGTQLTAKYNGSTGGGAQIKATNGFSSTSPVYSFWFNNNTGLGNPAANIVSTIINGTEIERTTAAGVQLVGLASTLTSGDFTYTSLQNAGAPGKPGGNSALLQYSNDASSAFMMFYKSRSATKGVGLVVQNNDDVGEISFQPEGGAGPVKAGLINAAVDGSSISSTSIPVRMMFWTTPAGATSPSERLRVGSNGNTAIGDDMTSLSGLLQLTASKTQSSWTTLGGLLQVNGGRQTDSSSSSSSTIATRVASSYAQPTFAFTNATSTITSAATLYVAGAPLNDASSAAITNATGLLIAGGSVATGGAVTNAYGLRVTAPTGAGNNYAATFASGNVGFGTQAPGALVDISGTSAGASQLRSYYGGSSGGGVEIRAHNGFSATEPVYAFWFNNHSGIGNPTTNVTTFIQNGSEKARIDPSGNVVINNAAIATNATDGFLYVPSCAGTPTGTPTTYTGRVPIVVDTTNNKLYFYATGAWRDAGP